MDAVISTLEFFGITPSNSPFLVLGVLILVGFMYMRTLMDKRLQPINERLDRIDSKLGKIKDNVLVLVSYLSTASSGGDRLDTSLIQAMSPMMITERGQEVLRESGFTDIASDPTCRTEMLRHVSGQMPTTRLDVENHAILSVSLLLERHNMKPVKAYLYTNPGVRETFPTLAGIYIRDEYLKDHPEISA